MAGFGVDIAVVAAALVFLLLGTRLLAAGLRHLSHAVASPGWPRAVGTVIASTTSAHTEETRDSGSHTMYEAEIRFRYQVAGRDYTTEVLHFGQTLGSGDSSDAELRRLRYPPGEEVTVAYKPADPAIAAAEPGFYAEALLLPAAGMFFVAPAVMFVVSWFGMSRENGFFGLGLFACIFVIIGAGLLTPGLVNLWRAREGESWPRVEGVIVYRKIDTSREVVRTDRECDPDASVSGAHLVYSYYVGDRRYYGNTRVFGEISAGSAAAADEVAARYRVSQRISVAYAPENPDLVVLEPGFQREALWLPGAGAAFLLFGLGAYFFGIPFLTRRG